MGLNWNEIKSREFLFRKTWTDASNEDSGGKKSYASDTERVAFLLELYQRITSLLPVQAVKKTRKFKTTES
jgi:hypothetical protein